MTPSQTQRSRRSEGNARLERSDVVASDVPGAVVVSVIVPLAPGCTVVELQDMPTGSVPQLKLMGLLNPRML
jgi:hypothetical protein